MHIKLTEFEPQPTTKKPYHNQHLKPSHIIHNQVTTLPRINNNQKLFCTIKGCGNNRDKFGKVCYEHFKYKRNTGTYNPTLFNFRDDCTKPSIELYKSGYTTPTIQELASRIDTLFANPYSHTIEIIKGARQGTLTSSKEKLSKYIKQNKPKTMTSHHIAIRLGIVFKAYQDGHIEGGSQLRFNLAKALLPFVSSSGQGLQIKEAIGNIVLKNYILFLDTIGNKLI